MARITMRNSQKATFAEVFEIYISAVTARGVKDKTIATYKQHFHAISKRLDRQQILDEFRNGQIQVLLTNPHTLAESVSLHSVCHDAIYFEYSYNLVHLLQSKDRIHRLGLPDDQYTQYYYHQISYQTEDGTWSLGEAVYQRLKEKEQIMLDAIDNHVLEAMPTSDEDLEKIFSKWD